MKLKIREPHVIPPMTRDKHAAREILEILKEIKNGHLNSSVRKSLSNYVVIRLASFIENFCRDVVREAIDEHDFESSGLFGNGEVILNVSDLKAITKNKKFTLGSIISYNTNFQSWNKINSTFTQLLGKEFNEKLIEHKESFTGTYGWVTLEFNKNAFHELIQLRHKMIHEMLEKEIALRKLERFFATAISFSTLTFFIFNAEYKSRKK